MNSWARISEAYDGGFTEFYIDLVIENFTLKIKETSFHYNAHKENLINEIIIPDNLKTCEEILEFIHTNVPSMYKVDINFLKRNEKLIEIIRQSDAGKKTDN